jgi:hypothetical protein
MATGLVFVKFLYPGHFGLEIPSHYFLTVDKTHALVRLLRNIKSLEVLDFTNELVPDTGGKNFRQLRRPIDSPGPGSMELTAATKSIATEREDILLHDLNKGKVTDFPHRLTIDPVSREQYRLFKTRDWTDVVISYETENVESVTPQEAFFQKVWDRFIATYRLKTKDSRILYFEDVHEAIHWHVGTVIYSVDEMLLSPVERLAASRPSVQPKHSSISFPYAHEGFFEFDVHRTTQEVFDFLKTGRSVSIAEELLLKAHEAAYHRKNFRYALVESFTAAELCVSNVLNRFKLSRGVSKGKLEEYRDEVPMAYKLNVELAVLLETPSDKEKQVIGDVNWLRKERNAVVHDGKVVIEAEARRAVCVAHALFEMLSARGVEQ